MKKMKLEALEVTSFCTNDKDKVKGGATVDHVSGACDFVGTTHTRNAKCYDETLLPACQTIQRTVC